ncbi:hypothetical protein D3C86_2092030 [compost metagenome]
MRHQRHQLEQAARQQAAEDEQAQRAEPLDQHAAGQAGEQQAGGLRRGDQSQLQR